MHVFLSACHLSAVQDNWTPLRRAAHNGHERVVRALLAAGADLQALHDAASDGHEGAVRLLLIAGADKDARDSVSRSKVNHLMSRLVYEPCIYGAMCGKTERSVASAT